MMTALMILNNMQDLKLMLNRKLLLQINNWRIQSRHSKARNTVKTLTTNTLKQRLSKNKWAEHPTPPQAAAPTTRIKKQAPPPKQSTRVQREAQPSFISDGKFELPPLNFMQDVPPKKAAKQLSPEALEANARTLEGVLDDFGIKGEIINVHPGPVVTLYELEPAPGIKSARIIGLADDIARSMAAVAARVAVIPGRNAIGIELPNAHRETVFIREILASKVYEDTKAKLPLNSGQNHWR
ncbi:DNA translocase FtsK [Nymphon striatum]|nr:DNA translocase FtsK [Nymphon striatum]